MGVVPSSNDRYNANKCLSAFSLLSNLNSFITTVKNNRLLTLKPPKACIALSMLPAAEDHLEHIRRIQAEYCYLSNIFHRLLGSK